MKVCGNCGKNKRDSSFNKKTHGRLQSYCRICDRLKRKERYRANPEQYKATIYRLRKILRAKIYAHVESVLRSSVCIDCSESDIRVLEFDHVRGRKKFSISVAAHSYKSIEAVKSEIEKCDVRCCNCHRKRTLKGTVSWRCI